MKEGAVEREVLFAPDAPVVFFVLGLSLLLSLLLAVRLWRCAEEKRIGKKVFWTLLLMLPLFGPVLYAAIYRMPSRQAAHLRGKVNQDAVMGGPWR